MSTQNPLISLSQEMKSQESLKSFTEMHYRMEARKLMEEVIDKPQTPSLYISLWPKQRKFGIELIGEMNKPPIPPLPVVTHQPIQRPRSPPILYFSRFERKRWNGLPRGCIHFDEGNSNLIGYPQSDGRFMVTGRSSQPGFS